MNQSPTEPRTESIVIAPGRILPQDFYGTASGDDASDDDPPIQNRAMVLSVLFLVTGALGIPMLWRCQRFTRVQRWFWAVAVTLYTLGLIAGAVILVRRSIAGMLP